MFHPSRLRKIAVLSCLAAMAMGISSWGGIFWTDIYAKEAPSWAAQGMGQDLANLFFVVPLLLISAFFAARGRKVFLLILAGIFIYLIYSYLLYGFCVHFNRLFLAYCASLGLSFYGLVLTAAELPPEKVKSWFDPTEPTLLPSIYFMALTAIFYFLWLAEDLPALWSGTQPPSLAVAGLFTNPVHVLDLSIVLPAMFISSLQLRRKKSSGYLLFPVMMTFSIVMGVAIIGMILVTSRREAGGNLGAAGLFSLAVLLTAGILSHFFRTLKRSG